MILGKTRRGRPIELTDTERSRHVHIIGSTGTGKSKLLEYMVRQDIAVGRRGLCLLDPHGSLCEKIEQWCALRGFGNLRKIHLINPGDHSVVPGFNPLRTVPGEAVSVRVDAMVAACAQAWGVRDLSETPRLLKVLRALLYVLTIRNLTLAEALEVLRANDPDGVRRMLTDGLPDPTFEMTWGELRSLTRKEFSEYAESTVSRLSPFLSSEAMRLVVGQREHAIDFRAAMDNGEIVLVNLGNRAAFSYENARLLGTLLINDLFLTALGRSEAMGRKHPFTLYIDEAYDFLSGDIERILDQTRKFGLHAVLAHQRIGQLRRQGDSIYNAVMGITNKVILGGLADEDAEVLAKEVMRGDIDLKRRKHTIISPVVVDEVPFWLETESWSEGSTHSHAFSESISTTESTSLSESETRAYSAMDGETPEQRGLSTTVANSSSASTTTGTSFSEGFARSRSHSTGRAQTLRPVREDKETSVQFYSLDEGLHLATLRLRELPDQFAIVKRRSKRTVEIKTVDVKPMLKTPNTIERFRKSTASRSPYVAELQNALHEIETRRAQLIEYKPTPKAPADQFWEEAPSKKSA